MKRQATDWEKLFAKEASDKGLLSKTKHSQTQYRENCLTAEWLKDADRHSAKQDSRRQTYEQVSHLVCRQVNTNANKSPLHSYQNSQMLTTDDTNAGEEPERPEPAPSLQGVRGCSRFGSLQVSEHTAHALTTWPAVKRLSVHPEELKIYAHT